MICWTASKLGIKSLRFIDILIVTFMECARACSENHSLVMRAIFQFFFSRSVCWVVNQFSFSYSFFFVFVFAYSSSLQLRNRSFFFFCYLFIALIKFKTQLKLLFDNSCAVIIKKNVAVCILLNIPTFFFKKNIFRTKCIKKFDIFFKKNNRFKS